MRKRRATLVLIAGIALALPASLPSWAAESQSESAEVESSHHVNRHGPQEVQLHSNKRLRIFTVHDKTFAELTDNVTKHRQKIALSRGKYTDPKSTFQDFSLLGQLDNGAVVITETYHTDANPNGYCGAGEEKMLQVLSTKSTLAETLAVKIESCVETIEVDPIKLNKQTNSLTIHRLMYGAKSDELKTYKLPADGKTVETASEIKPLAD